MCRQIGNFLALAALLASALPLVAQFTPEQNQPPTILATHAWSATGIKPGGQITLAVTLEIPEGYYIKAYKPGASSIPTTIEIIDAPAFVRNSTPVFGDPHEIEIQIPGGHEKVSAYTRKMVAYLPIVLDPSAPPGKYSIQLKARYQACFKEVCFFPTETTQTAQLDVVAASSEIKSKQSEVFKDFDRLRDKLKIPFFGLDFQIAPSKLSLLLLIAAIGGFLLNLTPCVLPLVPIKIMGLAQAAGNRSRCLLLGVTLSLGIVAFWLAMAVAISSISGFDATNKLFQFPAFTLSVGLIICVMAVGMSGLFTVRLPHWVYAANPSQDSLTGAFLFGIMTAVLSTPCTAPFMGAAAAWSATQPAPITFSTFGAIGLGMAVPYLVLAAWPNLVKRVPRTGPASELVKQIMGLLMLAAGAYFLGTGLAGVLVEPPDPPTLLYWWGVAVFIAVAGAWLIWRTIKITPRFTKRAVFGTLGLLLIAGAVSIGYRFTRTSPIHWVYYTPTRFADAQKADKVVLLEFTAAWCLNCQALEQTVLHNPSVAAALNSSKVVPIKVDITGKNTAGNQKLVEVGRRAIPYLVVYAPHGREVFASDAYTVEQLMGALREAAR